MKKIVKNLFLSMIVITLFGFTFSQNVKTLNSNINVVNISNTQANNYRQTCLSETNNDDNLRWAYYVWNSANPKYGYSYSSSNANRARSVLDSTSMLVYNPSTFSTNWIFQLLSNITLNGGNTKITKSTQNIPIINNTVWRNNLAGIFVLQWDYRTVLLGSTNSSNFLWYRIDYFQNTPLYVEKNYSFVNSTVTRYSCVWYYVAKCGDGVVDNVNKTWNTNTDGKYWIIAGWNLIQWSSGSPNEVCDDGANNGNVWHCNSSCNGFVSQLQVPTCTLNVIQNTGGVYSVNYNISGTFTSALLGFSPSVTVPAYNITNNIWTISNIVPNSYGTFTAIMTVTNAAGSNICQGTFYVPPPEEHECGDGHIDRPNDNGIYEQCDNGPSFGDGCNNQCQLMTPSCTLMADSQYQLVWNPVTFAANKDIWATYYSFNLWDTVLGTPNIIYTGDIIFPYQYMYTNMLSYNPILTVQNNHSPIATGVVRPTAICDTDIQVVNGCDITVDPYIMNLWDVAEISWQIWPDFNIPAFMYVSPALVGTWPHNVYYKTWHTYVWPNITSTWTYTFHIDAMTSNGYPFSCTGQLYVGIQPLLGELDIDKILLTTGDLVPGDFVDYRIELTNIWSGTFYDAYINDVMPTSLDLIYHNLVWVYPYDSAQWQDIYWNRLFEYSGFDLAPGQTVYVNVRWQIRDDASANNTTNCSFTSGDYSCVMYGLASDPYILKSQMMSNNIINTVFTTGTINVNTGDYITYRIDFENMWWENTTWGVRVVDHMPLCINYVSANIYGVSGANFLQMQDINGRRTLEYGGFDLLAWQWWYMIVTGQVMDSSMCNSYTTYTNDSYVYFYNPMVVKQSSTTAVRANKSIVIVTKDSSPDIHLPGDNKLFVVQVQNTWPNSISNIILEDIWPNSTCISYVDRTGNAGFTKNPATLVWTHWAPLAPGATLNLYISWSIANNPSCVNPDYENIVNLRYTEMWIEYIDQANYHFAVDSAPFANISLLKTADKNIVSSGDDITYTIVYQNMWNTALSSYIITDYWPGVVEFISATPFPSNIVNITTWSILTWNFYTPLLPGQTWQIIIQWEAR